MSVIRWLLSVGLAPLLLSLLSATGCYVSAGATLGVFIGGVVMVGLLVPALVLTAHTWRTRGVVLLAILTPFWGVWLSATIRSDTWVTEWLACCVVLAAWAGALAGVAVALRWARLPALASSAVVTLAGLAWLTWPIWMSRTWDGAESASTIAPFVKVHPGLVVNGQLFRQFESWTERSIAYRLTDLYQNVPYALPKSIWPCVLVHGGVAAVFIGLSVWVERRRATEPPPAPAPLTAS
jgi:hypothetical protein